MLVEQASEAYFVWLGVRPDTFQVLTELRREVDAAMAAAAKAADDLARNASKGAGAGA
jgi:hypothetical protein